MIYHRKPKLIIAISLMLTILLACGATAIGAYAAPTPVSNKVVCGGGVYYIFCDGADESDKPIAGVTEGSIQFVLVRKDGYTLVGPFGNISSLHDEVVEQCKYMLKAQSITQEETYLILEVAANIQLGNEERYKQLSFEDKEYSKWNIDNKNEAYYFENKRVRIFMDLREDHSLANFHYDKLGTIDIRLMRGHNGDIVKIEYLPQTEATEILDDLDIAHSDSVKEDKDISCLSKDMVSEKVLRALNSCETGTWYVILENGCQYLYYNGIPHNYAWQPEFSQDSTTIQIFDMGKLTGTYVLLKIPENLKLAVYYNTEKITYKEIRADASQSLV